MKKNLRTATFMLSLILTGACAMAQSTLAPDQNPSYAVSRDKYMRMADSINQWHTNTFQETYQAYDWYEAKMERKEDRRQFRRELRLERARSYNNQYYYRPGYDSPYNYYNGGYNPYRFRYRPNFNLNFCW